MRIDNLPPLREVISQHGLITKKALGQNFLFDLNLTSKIARQAGELANQPVIEIGPGPGALTRALLAQGAIVTAVERDLQCAPILDQIAQAYPNRLRVLYQDALKIDLSHVMDDMETKPKIVANLPYNIGTQLLVNWLLTEEWPPFFQSLTLMFQKEVAERIVAMPGTPHYGRLAVLSGWRSVAKIVFDIPKQAFTPPPKIMSSLVHIIPRQRPLACDKNQLGRVTKAAFGQRRKMLRQSLKALGGEKLLAACDIDATRRAETLSVAEFVALANQL